MKVLDPQSALLSNAELHQFLQANPPRAADSVQGAYPRVNLSGFHAIRKDLATYAEEITPHVGKYENVDIWMSELVKRLKPFGLTKTEVLNLINMGVGVRSTSTQDLANGDAEAEELDEDAELSRDIQFFRVAVEEIDERFPEEDDERIREVISIMRECIKTKNES